MAQMRLTIARFCCATIGSAGEKLPRFADYPASPSEGAKLTPNFAGEFRLATTSCGSDSIRLTITNVISGEALDGGCYWVGYKQMRHRPSGIKYRLDSRLLIASGCRDGNQPDPGCATFYYLVTTQGMHLLHLVPVRPPFKLE
jgi:hypothetical protein